MIRQNVNIIRLRRAGILRKGVKFTVRDQGILGRLSKAEVTAIISVRRKLGTGFVRRHTGKHPDLIF